LDLQLLDAQALLETTTQKCMSVGIDPAIVKAGGKKAAQALGGNDRAMAEDLAGKVVIYLEEKGLLTPTVEQIQDENIRGHIQEINDVATEYAESTKNESNKKRYEYMQQDIIDRVITKNQTAEQPLTLNTPQPAQPTSPNN